VNNGKELEKKGGKHEITDFFCTFTDAFGGMGTLNIHKTYG
jgi:hypothetical protein